MAQNQAAWLVEAGKPLVVGDAPMPEVGADEILVKNAAIAINPLDNHMQDIGVFVHQWPAILGCDIAGEVYEVGSDGAKRFKKGDRVIGHTINLVTGRPQDGAYALYSLVKSDKAAILDDSISFTDAVVVPLALEAAICALCVKTPGTAMPGVSTPALGLPYLSLKQEHQASERSKTLIVYGRSSSVGSMATQIATASGVRVISVLGSHNFDLAEECGAVRTLARDDPALVKKVVEAVLEFPQNEFVGIFDTISSPAPYVHDIEILTKLNGGHLVCTHPPPANADMGHVPADVSINKGMIFAVNDIATPVFTDFVTPALASGQLKCLPRARVVGKGLQHVQKALDLMKTGVSATKLVVEL